MEVGRSPGISSTETKLSEVIGEPAMIRPLSSQTPWFLHINSLSQRPFSYMSTDFADATPTVVLGRTPSGQSTAPPLLLPSVSAWALTGFHSVPAPAPAYTPAPVRYRVEAGSQTDPLDMEPKI